MNYKYFLALFLLFFILDFTYAQNDKIFMYGTVTTIENESYTGALRWGKEEVYWTDFFNATKTKNKNLDKISDQYEDDVIAGDSWSIKWMNRNKHEYSFIHQWVCQFGDIRSIEIAGRSKVKIELKDGTEYMLGDGSNDVGTIVKIHDEELGIIELNWNRIEKINFSKTPSKLPNRFGQPLYGTVSTSYGSFTGLVQWDHDERVSTDELDGEMEDGDFSIKFGKIKRIENLGNESKIELLSGRILTLGGTNDVDNGNRGIIVTLKDIGRVDIPWQEFISVDFNHETKISGPGYNEFESPKALEGTVKSKDGQILSGTLIYDLDEALDIEIIQGKDDELEYLIPLRHIRSIAPKNFDYATITLKKGSKLLLGEGQDVSDRNDGILVFSGNSDPKHVKWDNLKEVTFK